MKKNKKIATAIFGCISMNALFGCGPSDTVTQNVHNDLSVDQDGEGAVEILKNTQLSINESKCIGCGKCVRTAPKNFAMKNDVRKAHVISQEITSQSKVDRAVQICPTDAITQ